MPYRIVGGVRFYERKEVKDALAYLRVVANRADEVSMRRILNTPRRGIGERAEATVAMYAEQERIGFADALAAHADIPYLAPRSATAIAGFVALLDGLDEVVDSGGDPADVLTAVLERTGYRAELADSDDPQDASRLENLDQLVTVLREQAEGVAEAAEQAAEAVRAGQEGGGDRDSGDGDSGDGGAEPGDGETAGDDDGLDDGAGSPDGRLAPRELLSAVLEQLSLVADADSVPDSTEGVVTLMTLHTAKGLEFPVVFLTGWEDGIFPHQRSLGEEGQLAEERRLAYVGITRARRRLYVSRAVNRSAWGQQAANPASRFLDDIPESLVDWRRLPEPAQAFVDRDEDWPEEWSRFAGSRRGGSDQGYGSRYGSRSGRSAPVKASRFGSGRPRPGAPRRPPLQLSVGDQVSHDKYGLGTVKEVSGSGQTATAVIDFGSSGTVRLMLIGGVPMVKL
jgi:DNA helicase-2/ATP-dependent DNA helicase PcrA